MDELLLAAYFTDESDSSNTFKLFAWVFVAVLAPLIPGTYPIKKIRLLFFHMDV